MTPEDVIIKVLKTRDEANILKFFEKTRVGNRAITQDYRPSVNFSTLLQGSAFLVAHQKESICNSGDPGSIPGSGRSPGEEKGYPLQYSGLENSMDCVVHGVSKSWTGLSNFHFHSKAP